MLLFCVVFGCIAGIIQASYDGEQKSEEVEAAIYQLPEAEWPKYEKKFQTAVAVEANSYCENAAQNCGMKGEWKDSSRTFNETDMKFKEQTYTKPRLFVYFALQMPENSADGSKTMYFLNKEATEQVAGNAIERFREDTGLSITEVDGQFYGIPPDHTLNAIMIPIAFALLLGCAVAMCVLNYKCGLPPEPIEKEDNDVDNDKEAVRPMTQETSVDPQKC